MSQSPLAVPVTGNQTSSTHATSVAARMNPWPPVPIAAGYWAVLTAARALISLYTPLKMNYETVGNSVPHLHTHLVPRFTEDPWPGEPFPLTARQPEAKVPEGRLWRDVTILRELLNYE